MRVLDLFSGIGGFSLGLERAGMETVAFCEIDPYCRRVLAKHWPHVPIHNDIRELDGGQYAGAVDVICGGWPCQAHSTASRGRKTHEPMWKEYRSVIDAVGPRFVIAENVPPAPWRTVCDDLKTRGFTTELHDFHLPFRRHRRRRVYMVAYPNGNRKPGGSIHEKMAELLKNAGGIWPAIPESVGVDDGVPNRVDRIRALGNAVIPQIPEILGRAVMEAA